MMHEWVVDASDAGGKLLTFLSHHLGALYSSRYLKRAIENNRCLINGRTERFATTQLGAGDHVTLLLDVLLPSHQTLLSDPARILYEDDELLIYDKPPGINCDENGVLKILKAGHPTVQLVHRLDRDTTGVLLLAKSQESYLDLLTQFKKALIRKCYRTIVDGIVHAKEGVIDNYLDRKKTYAGQTIWGSVKSGGLHARTEWKRLNNGKDAALLHCFPKTGRTHQIRVHMAEMGHPILGDFQYGSHFYCTYRPQRYLLHAQQTSFSHPRTGKVVTIESPIPEDFITAQNHLFT
ncbi:MAG: RluA family pseudouridine synthase [Chlamydiales bacterium]